MSPIPWELVSECDLSVLLVFKFDDVIRRAQVALEAKKVLILSTFASAE